MALSRLTEFEVNAGDIVLGNRDGPLTADRLTVEIRRWSAVASWNYVGSRVRITQPSWDRRDRFESLIDAVAACSKSVGLESEHVQVALDLHLGVTYEDYLRKMADIVTVHLAPPDLSPTGFGLALYGVDSQITIDASRVISGGLYARLYRRHTADRGTAAITDALLRDEVFLLNALKFG